MKTYQGIITKKEFIKELKAHQKADAFAKGNYWDGERGCAVGCSLESIKRTKNIALSESDHSQYPKLLGIPEWLARVEDTIFEGLPRNRSKSWPVEFSQAIPENVDLEQVKTPFIICVLKSCLNSLREVKFDTKKFPDVQKAIEDSRAAVQEMIRCHKGGLDLSSAAWSAAWSAASSAARSAAWSAASSAASSAAESARSAAWSARSAAWSARSAARSAAYEYFADELIKLLRKAK